MQAGNLLLHIAGAACGPRDADRRDDESFVQQAEIGDHRHEAGEDRHVENQLRLDEVRAGSQLFLQPQGTEVEWRRKWILDRADEEARRLLQLATAEVQTAIA